MSVLLDAGPFWFQNVKEKEIQEYTNKEKKM